MASKPAQTKVTKAKIGDVEKKGSDKSKRKRTSIGASRNSRPKNRRAVRERR